MFNVVNDSVDSILIAQWPLDNTLNDMTRNVNALSMNGVVPFRPNINMPAGLMAAGPFTATDNLMASVKSNVLFNTVGNSWTMTCLMKVNVLDGGVIFSFFNNSTSAQVWVLRILASGAMRIVTENANVSDSAAGTITVNDWYIVAWSWDGTTCRSYATKVGTTPTNIPKGTTIGASVGNISTMRFGEENVPGFELPLNGYLKNIKIYGKAISNIAGLN